MSWIFHRTSPCSWDGLSAAAKLKEERRLPRQASTPDSDRLEAMKVVAKKSSKRRGDSSQNTSNEPTCHWCQAACDRHLASGPLRHCVARSYGRLARRRLRVDTRLLLVEQPALAPPLREPRRRIPPARRRCCHSRPAQSRCSQRRSGSPVAWPQWPIPSRCLAAPYWR